MLARHGVLEAVWHAGDAWHLATSQDTMHRITTQYGHIAAMQAQASDDDEATGPAAASGRTAATDDEGIAPTVAGARSRWDRIMSLFR